MLISSLFMAFRSSNKLIVPFSPSHVSSHVSSMPSPFRLLSRQINMDAGAEADRIRESGLMRRQALIGIDACDGKTITVNNPATDEVISNVSCLGARETNDAILAANDAFKSFRRHCPSRVNPDMAQHTRTIIRLINDHPFPDLPLHPTLSKHLPSPQISPSLVENILGGLFAAHTNGLKALEFFKFCIGFSNFQPTPPAFEMTLHILVRMRYFDQAWLLMEKIGTRHPQLLTLKSISILLTKIAKFKSYEDTLEAFDRLEKCAFAHRRFGTDEFNVLLRAFCSERQMKEAKSVFRKMHFQFPPDTKTMNILLVGFKESGDITAVELFYHEMLKRGFKPSIVTYGIRIDAYCKKGCFGDALRLLKEMESAGHVPTLQIITTLIHGAGIARNKTKALELFNDLNGRNITPDAGAYCALISSLVRCKDTSAAVSVMDEMEKNNVAPTDMTYHMIFYGLMKTAGTKGVMEIFEIMAEKKFVPQSRTVVMLMKFFCQNRRVDLGLILWDYLVERGCCPHDHALALLVTGLCSQGKLQEAFVCSKQILSRGRLVSDAVFNMLERHLVEAGEDSNLRVLDEMRKKLNSVVQERALNS